MEPFLTALAETLNALVQAGRVAVTETRLGIAVNQLDGTEAERVLASLEAAGWTNVVAADEGGDIPRDMVAASSCGVRVTATRPALPDGIEAVLTSSGFAALLDRDPGSAVIWVHGLAAPIDTVEVRYAPWGDLSRFVPLEQPPNAERVVRVLGRGGPGGHLGRWLLRTRDADVSSPALSPWRVRAASRLLAALAQEIEPEGSLLFRGPPPTRFVPGVVDLAPAAFASLQAAAGWVLENGREFENRHGLLAAEIARTSLRDGTLGDLAGTLRPALEGARIAYNFGITQQSKDTLKALGELRKAVSDEAAKLSDTTRSLGTAVVSAVLGNIGLIVARLTLPANATFIGPAAILLGLVLTIHVCATIAAGVHFISIQRELRKDWRDRLYRFLSEAEYERMVTRPARRAEAGFRNSAIAGGAMTLLLLAAVCFIAATPLPTSNPTGAVAPGNQITAAPTPDPTVAAAATGEVNASEAANRNTSIPAPDAAAGETLPLIREQ